MQQSAILKSNLFSSHIPVFNYNPERDQYEYIWSNGNRILFYSSEEVENDDNWIIFKVDSENKQYSKIKGDF